MSYRLQADRPLSVSVRDVLLEQLDDAIGRLREHAGDEPVETIHEARKDLKKARAVLRLVRTALPSDERRADLDALRDAGRRLAPFRDHDVAGETVDELVRRAPDVVDDATWALVREALQEAAERAVAAPREQEAVAVAGELARVRDGLAERIADDTVRRKHVRAGLRRTYRRGRKARKHAERGDDAVARHDWRKRVKDRWYHERLVRDAWPELLGAQVSALDELADALGREHDLVLLEGRLRALPAEHQEALAPLAELVGAERAGLQRESRTLGDRLYAERPKPYTKRLGGYARVWRVESAGRSGAAGSQ